MTRRPIWEHDCRVLDLVLIATFDWQDVANLLAQHGVAPRMCGCLPMEELAFKQLHDLCHARSPIAEQVQRRLDRQYGDAIAAVSDSTPDEVNALALRARVHARDRCAAGTIWAIFGDPREALLDAQRILLLRLQHAAYRAFFGLGPVRPPQADGSAVPSLSDVVPDRSR